MNTATKGLFAILLVSALVPASSAYAATTTHAGSRVPLVTNPIGTCEPQTFLTAPAVKGKLLILSVSWTVKNDEDSGISGFWALDHIKESLKVWTLKNGTFFVLKKYTGTFASPQGAISPGNIAGAENESVGGTIQGGYVAKFTGQFTPGANPTTGSLGVKDYGGTLTDVLKGTYGNGQTGDSRPFDFTTVYFTNVQNFNLDKWGWAYLLNPVYISGTSTNQWCNYFDGNSGDILVPSS